MCKMRLLALSLFAIFLIGVTATVTAVNFSNRQNTNYLDEADPNATVSIISMDVGNIRMSMTNRGDLGNQNGTPGYIGFEFPKNSGTEFLFSAGIWIGSVSDGIYRVSTTTDGDNGTGEFWPVHIGTLPEGNPDGIDWFRSSRFLQTFNGRTYMRGMRGIDDDFDWTVSDDLNGDGVPSANRDGGHGAIGYDDDHDGLIDEEIANGLDDDADGRIDEDTDSSGDINGDGWCGYDTEPHIDEDPIGDISHDHIDNDRDGLADMDDPNYDGDLVVGSRDDDGDGMIDEDGNAWGTQELFAVFQDDIQASYVRSPDPDGHQPLQVEVAQRSRAWGSGTATDFIINEYTIRNISAATLDSVYIAFFADPDIAAAGEGGDAASTDDKSYYNRTRQMAVQYDDPTDGDGWGPGVFACRILKTPAPLSRLRFSYQNYDRLSGGDPWNSADKYLMMSSGLINPPSPSYGDVRFVMAFGDSMNGGFIIPANNEITFAFALIGAADTVTLNTVADWALQTYYAENIPEQAAPPRNLRLLNNSPGNLQIAWSPPITGTIQGYNVFGRDSAGAGQSEQFNTALVTDTTFTVNGLTNGSDWLMQVQTIDDSGWASMTADLLVRVAAPNPVVSVEGQTQNGVISLHWRPNAEQNITGYRILRTRNNADSTYFTVADTLYSDSTARMGYSHEYRVAAMNSWEVQSFWSDPLTFTPFAPRERILVLDQTLGNPTNYGCISIDSVQARYHWLLDEIDEEYDYYTGSGYAVFDSLVNYDLVLWISENPRNNNSTTREQAFLSYRQAGGRMIRIASTFMFFNLSYPQGYYRGPFTLFEPLTFDSVYVARDTYSAPRMQMIGATSDISGFPSFALDTARLRLLNWSVYHYPFMLFVDTFWPRPPTVPLFRTVLAPTDTSDWANQPCAVIGPQMIVMAFPLYFMDRDTAKMILETCIDTLRGRPISNTVPQQNEIVPITSKLYTNYPNPFNPSTVIRFDLVRSGQTRLAVYNLLGQKVAILREGFMPMGSHEVRWNGKDQQGSDLGTGIYFVRLEAPDVTHVGKLILIR